MTDARTVAAADMCMLGSAPEEEPSSPALAAPTIVPDADAELEALAPVVAKVVVNKRLNSG